MILNEKIRETQYVNIYEDNELVVHFIGDMPCNKGYAYNDHTNPGYEICLVSSGKGFFKIGEQVCGVETGDLSITQPEVEHNFLASDYMPFRLKYMCFSIREEGTQIGNDVRKILDCRQRPIVRFPVYMEEIHDRIINEIVKPEAFAAEMTGMLVREFILLTARALGQPADKTRQSMELSDKVIKAINRDIEKHFALDDICGELGYSRSHVCRVFKEQTGFTVMEYYNIARLEKSKYYLNETDIPVTEIADLLKYSTIHHFSNTFKNTFGISPSEFRKK